jgi:hypothetical protein
LVVSSIGAFVNGLSCQWISLSTGHFNKDACHQNVSLPTDHIIEMSLCSLDISVKHHFVNWSFCLNIILSTGHFIKISFCQLAISSKHHFVYWSFGQLLSFHGLIILSHGHFVSLPFNQKAISLFDTSSKGNFFNSQYHQPIILTSGHFVN